MDKQFAAAVILIIFGFALTQMGQESEDNVAFLSGLGVGTIIIASFWIVLRIVSDIKRRQ